jgi:hypothetical protein
MKPVRYSLRIGLPMVLFLASGCEPVNQSADSLQTEAAQAEKVSAVQDVEEAKRCRNFNPSGNAYFGDLHIHTALSTDAYQQGVRTLPRDAYDYARGKEIGFHGSTVKMSRALDFAAVTDHAEFLGALELCVQGNGPEAKTQACEEMRQGSGAAFQLLENAFNAEQTGTRSERVIRALKVLFESEDPRPNVALCGENGENCTLARSTVWQKIMDAAESAYDRSQDCSFTSFVAYEYSGVITGSNYHRNIVFRNDRVPQQPISYLDAPHDYQLWQQLDQLCSSEINGCEYLSIPHNPNLSNGKLLTPDYRSAENLAAEKNLAALRQKSEPLLEIFQHKGQSECINGVSGIEAEFDELCEFEQIRKIGGTTNILDTDLVTRDCGDDLDDGGMINTGCVSRNDYFRGALLTGLQEERRLGINPLKLGVIASTDTHESTPGAVDEQGWQGHVGRENTLSKRLQKKTGLPYRLDGNPGGLAGVWAEENTRDALFDAMKRRETFGTSGPRIKPRFFAGWSYSPEMCEQSDFAKQAVQDGVPMGSDLSSPPDNATNPRFVAAALKDPEGIGLQKLQIIKGYTNEEGSAIVEIFDVAGDLDNQVTIDLETGVSSGPGSGSLCAVWTDENFNAELSAYYYLRVVENPSLRWSWAQCIALPEDQRPSECQNNAPKIIRERAWTSPIWYSPG